MHPCLSPSAAGNRRTGERVGHASLLVSLSRREPEDGRTSGTCILACLPRLPGTGGRENEWDMHPCLSPSAAGNRRTGERVGHASLLVSLSRREPENGRTSGICILACLPRLPGTGGRENEWDMHPCLSPSAAGNRRTGERVGYASLLVSLGCREPEDGRTSGICILACLPRLPGTGGRGVPGTDGIGETLFCLLPSPSAPSAPYSRFQMIAFPCHTSCSSNVVSIVRRMEARLTFQCGATR